MTTSSVSRHSAGIATDMPDSSAPASGGSAAGQAAASLRLDQQDGGPVSVESTIYESLLHFDDADVLELGCGKAEHTRAIAGRHPRARIMALEVDPIQHRRNLESPAPEGVRFAAGPAERIPVADASFDLVLMFKSLHHVPIASLDDALVEISRVLRPGGLVYLSEPVFAGELNEVIRVFHDEQLVRRAAFDAIRRAVASGVLTSVGQRFFRVPSHYRDFDDFTARMIGVTHTRHRLDPTQWREVRTRFARHMTADGAHFRMPMRVDLLRRPA